MFGLVYSPLAKSAATSGRDGGKAAQPLPGVPLAAIVQFARRHILTRSDARSITTAQVRHHVSRLGCAGFFFDAS